MVSKFSLPAALVILSLMQPALALEVGQPEQPPTAMQKMATRAKGAVGVVVGLALGTPIRIITSIHAQSKKKSNALKKDFTGEPDIAATFFSRVIGVPYGIVTGTAIGVVQGVPESVKKGYEWPFSGESIGLGE